MWKRFSIGLAVFFSLASGAFAQKFSLFVGGAADAQSAQAKNALFVVRTENCADLAKTKVTGRAEGVVQGARRSVRLKKLAPTATPGVHAVFQEWPTEGVWVVNLTGQCASSTASVVVAVGSKNLSRELSSFFSRPATKAEVDAVLKAMGGNTAKKK